MSMMCLKDKHVLPAKTGAVPRNAQTQSVAPHHAAEAPCGVYCRLPAELLACISIGFSLVNDH